MLLMWMISSKVENHCFVYMRDKVLKYNTYNFVFAILVFLFNFPSNKCKTSLKIHVVHLICFILFSHFVNM